MASDGYFKRTSPRRITKTPQWVLCGCDGFDGSRSGYGIRPGFFLRGGPSGDGDFSPTAPDENTNGLASINFLFHSNGHKPRHPPTADYDRSRAVAQTTTSYALCEPFAPHFPPSQTRYWGQTFTRMEAPITALTAYQPRAVFLHGYYNPAAHIPEGSLGD
ncbi:hypothetical protein P171DRAFT_511973 [Karstenula rhodostoma CBS 690.94]|uniref:Uncharacterized protein n=1 Tax=Karstenula rhodostoma CBS 690.94 TaxID=1392251 RepID=A0A9P4UDJ6_9PLEO|nr:hypothetical protein P171DRAFT_511973 [Karstenula rhodostoma CBS 690.94]